MSSRALKLDEFFEYLVENQLGYCKVLDYARNVIFASNIGDESEAKRPIESKQLVDFIRQRIGRFPDGIYTAECKKSPSSSGEPFRVQFKKGDQAEAVAPAQQLSGPNFDTMLEKALNQQATQFQLMLENDRLKREIEDLKKQPAKDQSLELVKEAGSTLGTLGMALFAHFNPEFKPVFQQMLGLDTPGTGSEEKTEIKPFERPVT